MIYRSVALGVLLCFATTVSSSSAPVGLFFYETFDDADPFESGKWTKSSDEKYVDQSITITSAKQPVKGFENDKGLQLSKEMKHYGISAKFPEPLSFKGQKELVIQYELKLEDTLACGGAYVKLPRLTDGLDLGSLNSATPYTIMFGPDKCGSTNNKVHFILQHQNPLTLQYEEKHFNDTPTVKMDKKYHLYTLSLKDDNSFEIYVDKKVSKKGNLLTHMKPSINPPKEIDDPEDKKPEDWVEEAKIDDPNAKKPDDWDESAPRQIPDPKAVKPEGWLDDAPQKIPDPSASKPEDWDDEEDGEWEAPQINNPDCKKAGCGPWSAPMVKNPAYKGKWKVPRIDNPAYKGPWKARKIPNTQLFEDPAPMVGMAPMAGLSLEIWTTNGGILFDNFAISHSLDAAFAFADSTYSKKAEVDSKKKKDSDKEAKKNARKDAKKGAKDLKKAPKGAKKDDAPKEPMQQALELFDIVVESVQENPWPMIATLLAAILALVLLSPSRKVVVVPAPAPAAPAPAPAAETASAEEKKTEASK